MGDTNSHLSPFVTQTEMAFEKELTYLIRPHVFLDEQELDMIISEQLMGMIEVAEAEKILKSICSAMTPELYFRLNDNTAVYALASLGEGTDRVSELYAREGSMLYCYAFDSICLFLLRKMYRCLDHEIRTMGMFVREYRFPDPDTEEYAKMIRYLAQGCRNAGQHPSSGSECIPAEHFSVVHTSSGMLKPLKTTCFTAYLTHEKVDKCHDICDSCSRTDCEMKKR